MASIRRVPRKTTSRRSGRAPARKGESRAAFHGAGGALFGIRIVNLFLAIVTLGVYWFWGKARTRRYLWGHTGFAGDRFSYHGTGMEALRGWVKAAAIFGIPYLALSVAPDWIKLGLVARVACSLLATVVLVAFIPVAITGARRYRLSRTAWRGIRFSFRGRTWEFAKLYWRGVILTTLTLGLYYPEYAVLRTRFLVDRSWLGNRRFSFDGTPEELKPMYWKALGWSLGGFVLMFFAAAGAGAAFAMLGKQHMAVAIAIGAAAGVTAMLALLLPWIWFGVAEHRFIWNHTKFGRARFVNTIQFPAYMKLLTVNALLMISTLGFASPWVTVRTMRFTLERIALRGPLAPGRISQQARDTTATGEETGDLFDIDVELG